MNEFEEYHRLRTSGAAPEDICKRSLRDGLGDIECIRMLRTVYRLSLPDAKEVLLHAHGFGGSLDQHQQALAEGIEEFGKQNSKRHTPGEVKRGDRFGT